MPEARRQFRVLYRDFLTRLVDLEILSTGGDVQRLLVQFAALLAAASFTYAVASVPRYVQSTLPQGQLLVAAWSEQEFLIASTMAIAGLFGVLAWNTVLPDRRDCLVLGLLPVRARTIFLAKVAAIGTALALSVAAVNSFTGLSFPFLWGGWRTLGAWWLTQLLAGLLVTGALLALQAVASQVLSYRLFLRASSFLQLASFFVILGVWFLKPPFTALAAHPWLAWMPSFWFFGLFQQLNGGATPQFAALAARALESLPVVFAIAAAAFGLAYRRNMRRIVEQPDIAPADRSRPATRTVRWLAARALPARIERAVLLFTVRSIARSRQHRLILAAYAGIALAIGLAYTRDLIYGPSSFEAMQVAAPWNRPNGSFLAASMIALFFAVIGVRAVFAMPIALRANWIFRLTAVHSPEAYFHAVRKSLYTVAADSRVDGGGCGFFHHLAGMGCGGARGAAAGAGNSAGGTLAVPFPQDSLRLLVPARQGQSERTAGNLGNRISFCGLAGRAPGILGDAELSAIRGAVRACCLPRPSGRAAAPMHSLRRPPISFCSKNCRWPISTRWTCGAMRCILRPSSIRIRWREFRPPGRSPFWSLRTWPRPPSPSSFARLSSNSRATFATGRASSQNRRDSVPRPLR